MRHKTLNAFTLLELLVGMILSGIVLVATFTAYRVVTRQYETYRDKSQSVTEISFFISRLESDFANASKIISLSENKIQLQNEERSFEYTFAAKYVLRSNSEKTDTFFVPVSAVRAYHKSGKINPETDSTLDELCITMEYEGQSLEKVYIKTEDPKSLIDKEASEQDTYGY